MNRFSLFAHPPGALRLWILPALILLAVALRPASASAQEEHIVSPYRWIEKSLRLGLYGGRVFADRGSLPLGPGSSTVFGARLRTRLSSPLSLEVNVGYGASDRLVLDPREDTFPAPVDRVDLDWLLVQLNMQIALTGARSYHRVQPYVLLGGGVLAGLRKPQSDHFAANEEDFRFDLGTKIALALGAGVEWDVSDRWGIGFEARDDLWRLKTPDGFFRADVLQKILDEGAPAPKESEWVHNLELSAALYYYF